MPLYEYECKTCDQVHEIIQKFSDKPLSECPTCQGPVQKLMSLNSFALKGSGWYTTDYKRKSTPAQKTAKAAPACNSGGGASCAGCPSAAPSA